LNQEEKKIETQDNLGSLDPLLEKQRKKRERRNNIIAIVFMNVVALGVFLIVFLWSGLSTSFINMLNCFSISGILILILTWLVAMTNQNLFTPVSYGFKSFFLMILGKKPEKTYYETISERKGTKIKKVYTISLCFSSFPYLLVSLILYIIFIIG
jgi:magnesium-transporting ATPase (P-type)